MLNIPQLPPFHNAPRERPSLFPAAAPAGPGQGCQRRGKKTQEAKCRGRQGGRSRDPPPGSPLFLFPLYTICILSLYLYKLLNIRRRPKQGRPRSALPAGGFPCSWGRRAIQTKRPGNAGAGKISAFHTGQRGLFTGKAVSRAAPPDGAKAAKAGARNGAAGSANTLSLPGSLPGGRSPAKGGPAF